MQENPEVLKEFEGLFKKIEAGQCDDTRPEMLGWTTHVKHLHRVEEAVVRLHQHMAKNLGIPLPKTPESAYERWQREREDTQENLLLADIFRANPKALGIAMN